MENVKNAIILAAGKGTRLSKYTTTTPKPLLPVKGKPMIEHIIDTLLKKGIEDIFVVTGYMARKFDYLVEKYAGHLTVIYNDLFEKANNMSSLMRALKFCRYYRGATIIMDADQYIENDSIVCSKISKSGYTCCFQNGESKEWGLTLDKVDRIKSCNIHGSNDQYIVKSLSYWTHADLRKLKTFVEINASATRLLDQTRYWDNIPLDEYSNNFPLKAYKIEPTDLLEFDTTEEYERMIENEKKA